MKQELTIYSKDSCIYCDRAKELLQNRGIEFREVLVDANDQCTITELQEKTGMSTFPQIFLGHKLIGGYLELKRLEQENGLIELI